MTCSDWISIICASISLIVTVVIAGLQLWQSGRMERFERRQDERDERRHAEGVKSQAVSFISKHYADRGLIPLCAMAAMHNDLFLHDSENLMSLAVDAAAYYEKNYRDTGYLDGLEAKRREVERSLANLVKVIESGLISETVTERLVQLEEQKRALNEAIEAENIRAALCEDEHTIKAYFEKFLHADFDNPETRDQVLEYFVDKIYLTDDGLVVTSWYSEDRTEVTWDMLYGEDGNPFVKGEAVKFDCFPFGSTKEAPQF